jgi:hypothetical protein
MKTTARRVRDIFTGLSLLGKEPITNHVVTFRIKNALAGLQPIVENLSKAEGSILAGLCELDAQGQPKIAGQSICWLAPENEAEAVGLLNEVLAEELELPVNVKPLSWELLERSQAVYTSKEGVRTVEPLEVSVSVQLLLGDFIEGEPGGI